MPTVPQYGDRQVSTAPLNPALQNPNIASADVYGAPIAENISRANQQVAQVNLEMRQRRIETDVLSGLNEYMRDDDNARNGQNGFMLRQGENARTSVDEYEKFSQDLTERIAKKYKDPETQAAFRQAAQQRFMSNRSALVSRTGQVLQKHEIDTKYAAADTDRNVTVNNFQTAIKTGDSEIISKARADLQGTIDRQKGITRHIEMDLNGLSADEAEAKAQAATNATVGMAVQSLLNNGDYAEAKSLYDSMEGQLDAVAKLKLQPIVQEGVDRMEIGAISSQIASETDESGNLLDEVEIRKRAEELTKSNPRIVGDVINRSIQERNRNLAAQAQSQDEVYSTAYRGILGGASYEVAVPPGLEQRMRPEQVAALRSASGLGAKNNSPNAKNIAGKLFIRSLIDQGHVTDADGTKRQVTQEMVFSEAIANGLTPTQIDEVTDYFQKRGDTETTTQSQVNLVLKNANNGNGLEYYAGKYPNFYEQVVSALPKGKKATDLEVQAVTSKLLASGEVDGYSYFSDKMTYAEAVSLGKQDQWLPQISKVDRPIIEKFIDKVNEGRADKLPQVNQPLQLAKIKKYMMEGYPPPYGNDGNRLTPEQAAYADVFLDAELKKKEQLQPPKATPARGTTAYPTGRYIPPSGQFFPPR